MKRAFLALGSNVGDRAGHLRTAVRRIAGVPRVRVVAASRVYDTDPVGGPEQAPFLNAVIEVETDLGPRELMSAMQDVEVGAGREADPQRRVRFGPRELDVDVLTLGDDVVDEEDLTVPHPRMGERAFVLAPLEDLAPRHPAVVRGRRRFPHGWQGVRVTNVELSIE